MLKQKYAVVLNVTAASNEEAIAKAHKVDVALGDEVGECAVDTSYLHTAQVLTVDGDNYTVETHWEVIIHASEDEENIALYDDCCNAERIYYIADM